MASKYDEDVYENPFFTKIISEHQDHLERAASCKGILCIPKFSVSSQASIITEVDIADHILLPTKENNNDEDDVGDDDDDYITVSGKTVSLSSTKVCTKYGFAAQKQVSVLFSETFHSDGGDCYKMFCIAEFLNRNIEISQGASSPTKHTTLVSYQQCMDLLWSSPDRQKVKTSLDRIMDSFAASYEKLEGESLRRVMDAANSHFTKAMQFLLRDSVVRKSARHNHLYMENLKIAVETYMMNAVHKQLFRVITATMAGEDAEINKITRNLVDLQLSDLGIRKIFSQNIIPAKKELSLLNRYSTPMGRLFCIKRVVAALTKPPKEVKKEKKKDSVAMMTTDDLLPILIFLIIKSDTPNWMANLVYMQHFHFAKSSDDDEFGFYLASVEAAIEHIRSGNIKNETMTLKRERWNSIIIQDPTDVPSLTKQLSPVHTSIDQFFKLVQEGDEQKVIQMLNRPNKTNEEVQLKLCHPLCSCDKCDKLLAALRNDSDLVTAYTRDNRGYTALHIAAYYGQGLLIDQLVKHQAIVDATDYLGLTPLHLACQRGYQNVMLLLVHFGADVMALDNEGNTPLHLSSANGHDDCVKALVFYDANVNMLNINATNEVGDTPLHLAAKWGYESIVKTLLESDADSTLLNRKKQTAVSLAQNIKVQRLLQLAADGLDLKPVRPKLESPAARPRSSLSGSFLSTLRSPSIAAKLDPDPTSFAVQTASLEEASEKEKRKHKEKLFKAIIEGDIQLVKFYLGIEGTSPLDDDFDDEDGGVATMSPKSLADMCHPLCQCDRCRNIQKASRFSKGLVDVNTRTTTGYCPIHMAVLHNHSDILALLISLHADISAQNHKSLTPLHLTCCVRNSLTTDMLIKAGARLDIQDMNGDTALLIAASNGFINGVHMLTQAGANLNIVNFRGNTALHEALKREHTDTAACLLKAGADPRIKNCLSQLPLQLTQDVVTQGLIRSAVGTLEEKAKAQLKKEELRKSTMSKRHKQDSEHQASIQNLFSAFEKADLDTLQELTAAIKSFNRDSTLKKAETKDRSRSLLSEMARKHSIVSFDRGTLKKVKSFDKTDPLYAYSLFQEACRAFDGQDSSKYMESLDKVSRPRDDSFDYSKSLSSSEGSDDWTIIFKKYKSAKDFLTRETSADVNSQNETTIPLETAPKIWQPQETIFDMSIESPQAQVQTLQPATAIDSDSDAQQTPKLATDTQKTHLQTYNPPSGSHIATQQTQSPTAKPGGYSLQTLSETVKFISAPDNGDLQDGSLIAMATNGSKGDPEQSQFSNSEWNAEQTQLETPIPERSQLQTPMPQQTQLQTPMPEQTQLETLMPEQTQLETLMPEQTQLETLMPEQTQLETSMPTSVSGSEWNSEQTQSQTPKLTKTAGSEWDTEQGGFHTSTPITSVDFNESSSSVLVNGVCGTRLPAEIDASVTATQLDSGFLEGSISNCS